MVYRVLADAVVVTHFAFIAFVVTGPYLARLWRPVVWLHLPALAWAVGIVAVGYECPLTALENHFRRLAGELSRLAVCAEPSCAGIVLDLSRNRSRRFCSTACGNRVAVAAYRARRR